MVITKDTPLTQVLRTHPYVREIFARHGMGCIGCLGSVEETIETAAKMHDVDLPQLLQEINALLSHND